ncbi:MAG: PAS domain S-box protein [Chloroflexota bacterium]|nr:PAS domain S-box protein [Chloroflexota bacterium]
MTNQEHSTRGNGHDEEASTRSVRKAKQCYLSLLDSVRSFTAVLDNKGVLRFVTEDTPREFGFSTSDVIGKPFWEAIWFRPSSKSRSKVRGAVEGALRGRDTVCETEAFTADGAIVPVVFSMRLLPGEDKNIISVFAQVREEASDSALDILNDKSVPATADNPIILQKVGDGIVFFQKDRMVFVNQSMMELTGYIKDDFRPLSLKSMIELLIIENNTVSSDTLIQTYSRLSKDEDSISEVEILCKDGTKLSAMLLLSNTTWQGNAADMMLIKGIIPSNEVGRTASGAETRLFEAMFNNPLQIVYVHDEQGRFVDANDKALEIMGYRREELGKVSFPDIIHPDDISKTFTAAAEVLEKGHMEKSIQIRIYNKSGQMYWVDCHSLLLEQDGMHFKAIGIARDITGQVLAEDELRRSEEKLRDLVEKLKCSQEPLSVPVVQIWSAVLALPLIGVIDEFRAQNIMDVLLSRIVETQAVVVILDVTGVSSMDTSVTGCLMKTIEAVRLLGAECVVTGIRPDVAHSIVGLGVDMGSIVTKRDMQEGLRWALNWVDDTLE